MIFYFLPIHYASSTHRCQVPGNLTTSDRLNVTIDVLFPKMSPVILEDLYTTLPMFHQQFGDLAKHIKFRNVVLQGSGRGIVCEVRVALECFHLI